MGITSNARIKTLARPWWIHQLHPLMVVAHGMVHRHLVPQRCSPHGGGVGAETGSGLNRAYSSPSSVPAAAMPSALR